MQAARMMDKWDQVVEDGKNRWIADVRQVWTRQGTMTGLVVLSDGRKARVAYVRPGVWQKTP